jgi:biopolymer transport protein ExbD
MMRVLAASFAGVILGACQPKMVSSPKVEHPEPVRIVVDYDGQITLNGDKISEKEFYERLEQMARDPSEKPNQ